MRYPKMKYDIDEHLLKLAKLNQPMNRLYFAVANALLHPLVHTLKGRGLRHEYLRFKTEYGKVRIHLVRDDSASGELPCMVYYHGGAFMRYAAAHHYRYIKKYAKECGCAAAFVDFYPAPRCRSTEIEGQCLSAYLYLLENAHKLSLDADRFMTAGDSSGGFLAIKTVSLLCERGIKPRCNMLIYPLIYGLEDTESVKKYTDTPVWNSTVIPKMWGYYLDDGYEWTTAEKVCVPTYMEIAEFDCLHDADLRFCDELEATGGYVEKLVTRRTIHGYDAVDYEVTRLAFERRRQFLQKFLIAPDICRK